MKNNKITAGLAAGALMLVAQMLLSTVFRFLFPTLQTEYTTSGVFRPWTDPLMSLMFVHPFVVAIILAFIWDKTKAIIVRDSAIKKGLYFGLIYFVLTLPGMLMSYSSFPVSGLMIFSWTAGNFVQALCAGIVLSKMIK